MDDYIAKPLHKQELLQAISEQTARKPLPIETARAGSGSTSLHGELDIEGGNATKWAGTKICSANFAACFCRRVRL